MDNEWSLWLHLQGLIIGVATFLIIGLFRVMLSFELKNLHKRK